MASELGKTLIFFGLTLAVLGLVLTLAPHLRIGRLPGDMLIRRENWSLYLPLTTSILLSLFVTLLFWIINLLRK